VSCLFQFRPPNPLATPRRHVKYPSTNSITLGGELTVAQLFTRCVLFVKSEIALLCSQEHLSGFHPESAESAPDFHAVFI
jgi:hypothetical protein